jgi:hypothetical protein
MSATMCFVTHVFIKRAAEKAKPLPLYPNSDFLYSIAVILVLDLKAVGASQL